MKKNIWDFWAGRYDRLWVQRFSLGPTRRAILANIPVRPEMNILDMGCGVGQLFGDLKPHFGDAPFRYTGVDASTRMIETASANHPDGTFAVASSDTFHAGEETFDVIVCAHAFPYFPDKPFVLETFRGLLKAGGTLLIAQASVNNPYDAVVLSVVRLTTTKASYPSRRRMRALAEPVFRARPDETRISPNPLIPSIYLFKWTRNDEATP